MQDLKFVKQVDTITRRLDTLWKKPEVRRNVKVTGITFAIFMLVLSVSSLISISVPRPASATNAGQMRLYLHKEPSDLNATYNAAAFNTPEASGNTATGTPTTNTFNPASPALCEGSTNTGEVSTKILAANVSSAHNACVASFISSPVGQAITVSAGDTAPTAHVWVVDSIASVTGTWYLYIYKYSGSLSSADIIATLSSTTDPSTSPTAATWTSSAITAQSLSASDRILIIATKSFTSTGTGTSSYQVDTTGDVGGLSAAGLSYVSLGYTATTPNKPDLNGSKDDDFTVGAATTACTTGGVAYNTKWTCLHGTAANTAGSFNNGNSAGTVGDTSGWLVLNNQWNNSTGSVQNFGTTPSNTYMYQPIPSGYRDGTVRTVVNSSIPYTVGVSAPALPYFHTGIFLWTSNTDFIEVIVGASGVKSTVNKAFVGYIDASLSLTNIQSMTYLNPTTTSGLYNRVWIGISKSGSTYTPQYSTDGTSWSNIGSGVTHAAAYTRTGLNAFSVINSPATAYAGAFDWFDYSFGDPAVTVSTTGSQTANVNSATTGNYLGGAFTFVSSGATTSVASIKISEKGTVNANTNLANLKLYYETSASCTRGSPTQFGTGGAAFDASDTATITGTMSVGTSQICVYADVDVGAGATNGQSIDIEISNPSTEVVVGSGVVTPATAIAISGSTNIVASSNQNPNVPASLTQKTSPAGATIAESAWTTDSTPTLGFTITDPDANDVKYRLQIDGTSSAFANLVVDYTYGSLSASGTTFAYTVGQAGTYTVGSAGMTLSDSATGYWWRVKAIDTAAAESAYVEPGVAGTVDMKVDATAPSGGTVKDGTGSDQDYNNGSLNQLSANWTGTEPVSTVSGLQKYEYAIRRTSDSYYWNTASGWQAAESWVNNATGTTVTVNSMNLSTSVNYYFSVKVYDNAGNVATILSNGQQVLPTLGFTLSTNTLDFTRLGVANSWTDTKNVTLSVSTNAANGYTIKSWAADSLRSVTDVTKTIADFVGTWLSPQNWLNSCKDDANDCGFGYTSNDTTIEGANKFSGGTLFAKNTLTAPGSTVADHTDAVNGLTGAVSNEQFIITHKVSVNGSQAAQNYQANVYYVVTANY